MARTLIAAARNGNRLRLPHRKLLFYRIDMRGEIRRESSGCVLGKRVGAMRVEPITVALQQGALRTALALFAAAADLMDLLFLGIAVCEGYKFAFRPRI